MTWIALLAAAWLVAFLISGVMALWIVADVAPLTTGAWAVVMATAGLLASASTMMLAARRRRREAEARRATVPASAVRSERRLGNGYAILAAALTVVAVMLVLVYRLAHVV